MNEYTIIQHIPVMGRSQWLIQHSACGKWLYVFPWSFAGHGKKKCPHCNTWIKYDCTLVRGTHG